MNDKSLQQLNEQFGEDEIQAAIEKMEEQSRIDSEKQAAAFIKKNKVEIKRLNEHAQGAVLENNFPAYKYAIEKLRKLYRQPSTDELVVMMWETTRREIWKIINDNSGKV